MTTARIAPVAFARARLGEMPRRVVAARVEWRALGSLGDVREAWHELSNRALEPNVFYDAGFALAAAPVFGADVGAVLAWSKSGQLIGLFPARIERRYGVMAALTGWTHPYAPLGVPLVDRDEADAAIGALLDHVETEPGFPRLALLPLVARDGAFAAALARVLARRGGQAAEFGAHARALLAPKDLVKESRENYLEHVAGKKLKELRRQRRRLDEKGVVDFVSARTPDEIAPALADYLMLEASGWKGRAGTAARQNREILLFVQGAIAALAADGHVHIDRLTRGHTPLAASITLQSGDASWFWKIAYDEDAARFSPGVQLTLDVTKAMLESEGGVRVDSCATADHPMIDAIWRERLALSDFLIAPNAAAASQFHIARQLESLRRVLISSAKVVRDKMKSSRGAGGE